MKFPELKGELIDEINDLLGYLSPVRARQILSKLTTIDLIDLKQAIEVTIRDSVVLATSDAKEA